MNPEIQYAINEIFKFNPSLKPFYDKDDTLIKYSKSLYDFKIPDLYLERQKIYRRLIDKYIKKIFSSTEQKNINLDLKNPLIINTADHHGLLNHPILLGGNIVTGYYRLFNKKHADDNHDILGLTCGNVPLNEVLNHRGFDLHNKHLNLFPKSDKHKLIQTLPKIEFNFIHSLERSKEIKNYSKSELDFLEKIENIIMKIDFSTCTKYSEQITKINYYLWPLIFAKDLRADVINLIQLEHDEILIDLLSEFFKDKESFVYQAIFDPVFRPTILKLFNGIYGCWEEGKDKGTHFFWGLKDGEQVRLAISENRLISSDPEFKLELPLNSEAVIEALEKQKIIPSIFIKFAVLAFYCGIKAIGGMGQIGYVTQMRGIWSEALKDLSPEEVKFVANTNTTGLINLSLFFKSADNGLQEQSAFDVIYDGGINKNYFANLNRMKFKDFMLPTVPLSYHRNVPPDRRRLLEITPEELYVNFKWVKKIG